MTIAIFQRTVTHFCRYNRFAKDCDINSCEFGEKVILQKYLFVVFMVYSLPLRACEGSVKEIH